MSGGNSARFTVEGPRGGTITGDLRQSQAWRHFVGWLAAHADNRGWAQTTGTELAKVLYPREWKDAERGDDASHKLQVLRNWQRAGYLMETGDHEYALNQVQSFGVGLTMKGVRVSTDMGIRNVPPAVGATPLSVSRDAPAPIIRQMDVPPIIRQIEPEPVALPEDTVDPAPVYRRSGPPAEVTRARLEMMRNMRDALTFALYLNDHPVKCDKTHVDDLSADGLFDLAVAKAKAG